MKNISFDVPDRDYAIVAKCAFVSDLTVEELAWHALKVSCSGDLECPLAELIGFDADKVEYADIWSPDIEKMMKAKGVES